LVAVERASAEGSSLHRTQHRRWVIPKGWPMKGRSPHGAAAMEASEEAGLVGKIEKKKLVIPLVTPVIPVVTPATRRGAIHSSPDDLRSDPCRRCSSSSKIPTIFLKGAPRCIAEKEFAVLRFTDPSLRALIRADEYED
jgi:8-oxo-dGTP pyrophosphatase MutT (NUDIX family)